LAAQAVKKNNLQHNEINILQSVVCISLLGPPLYWDNTSLVCTRWLYAYSVKIFRYGCSFMTFQCSHFVCTITNAGGGSKIIRNVDTYQSPETIILIYFCTNWKLLNWLRNSLFLWNSTIYHHVHKSQPLNTILSQFTPIYTFISDFSTNHFIIIINILPSTPSLLSGPLNEDFRLKFCVQFVSHIWMIKLPSALQSFYTFLHPPATYFSRTIYWCKCIRCIYICYYMCKICMALTIFLTFQDPFIFGPLISSNFNLISPCIPFVVNLWHIMDDVLVLNGDWKTVLLVAMFPCHFVNYPFMHVTTRKHAPDAIRSHRFCW
jgi:hypothetical protein